MQKTIYSIVATSLLAPVFVFAADFRMGEQPSIGAGEHVTNDVYLMGGSATSAGTVVGDVVAAGGSVAVSGIITGDVAAAGGNVTILGDVGDDIRAAGGNVTIQGRVGGDVLVGGGQISVGGYGIEGDVAVGGGMVRIDAPVAGNVRIGGGNVYINAPVAGNMEINADSLTLGSSAVIRGVVNYKGKKEIVKEPGAVINGAVHFTPHTRKEISPVAMRALFSLALFGKFLALLLGSLVFGLMFRRLTDGITEKAFARPFAEFGKGVVILAAMPVISIMLLVTIIGIPLGILGLIGFVALILLSWLLAPIIVGRAWFRYALKQNKELSWKTISVGVILFSLFDMVPFIGWMVQAFVILLALGAILSMKWDIAKMWR